MTADCIISKELLKKVTGEFDLASITKLNVRELGISKLGVIGKCSGLIHLDLSGNRISDVRSLELLKKLTTLDLSCNRITSLVGLEGLESLRTLNIAGNLITSVDSLQPLANLEFLENLHLKDKLRNLSNPVCQTLFHYKISLCKLLGNLSMLDGERVSGKGSEVFQMCDEIELKLNDVESIERTSAGHIYHDSQDLDEKLHGITSQKAEEKVEWSADQQFKDLLVECRNLNEEADQAIQDAKQALWGTSKEDMP